MISKNKLQKLALSASFMGKLTKQDSDISNAFKNVSIEILKIEENISNKEVTLEIKNLIISKLIYLNGLTKISGVLSLISLETLNVYSEGIKLFLEHVESLKIFTENNESEVSNFVKDFTEFTDINTAPILDTVEVKKDVELIEKVLEKEEIKVEKKVEENRGGFRTGIHPEIIEQKAKARVQNVKEEEDKKDDIKLSDTSSEEIKRGIRKAKILKLLELNGGLSIKDLAMNIKEVGDKTIQRDLLELLMERKIFKVGERRWSKYYIK